MNIDNNFFDGVGTVLVVDDKVENCVAAREAIHDIFPDKRVLQASSAKEAKKLIANNNHGIDFVLSDMQMEERYSGFYVAHEAWSRYIPTVVVTAGDHHGSFVLASNFCNPNGDSGTYYANSAQKDDKESWKNIIRGIEKHNSLSLRVALIVRERANGKKCYDREMGEILARLTCTGMGNLRECSV